MVRNLQEKAYEGIREVKYDDAKMILTTSSYPEYQLRHEIAGTAPYSEDFYTHMRKIFFDDP